MPEEVIFGLLSKRLEEGFYKGETGFILDGIPRTRMQAVSLDFANLCVSVDAENFILVMLTGDS